MSPPFALVACLRRLARSCNELRDVTYKWTHYRVLRHLQHIHTNISDKEVQITQMDAVIFLVKCRRHMMGCGSQRISIWFGLSHLPTWEPSSGCCTLRENNMLTVSITEVEKMKTTYMQEPLIICSFIPITFDKSFTKDSFLCEVKHPYVCVNHSSSDTSQGKIHLFLKSHKSAMSHYVRIGGSPSAFTSLQIRQDFWDIIYISETSATGFC